MRFIRVMTSIVFVLVMALSVFLNIKVKTDNTAPKIEISTDNIEETCDVSDEKLLSYVTATDNKDGDLTDKVFVENISQFIEEGVSNITFCVSDNDGNVAKKTVNLTYTDYRKPVLKLHDDLVFYGNEAVSVGGCATVDDCFDSTDYQRLSAIAETGVTSSGTIPVKFKYSNSKGFTYTWNIDALVFSNETKNRRYQINLKENLLILEKDSKKPDYKSYFLNAQYDDEEIEDPSITIDSSEVKLSKTGTYNVWYKLYDEVNGERTLVSKERLIIICEDSENEGD
ncbi:MAG: hypothetical protein ACI4W6_08815 [Acutalibacteraceae bacterium]